MDNRTTSFETATLPMRLLTAIPVYNEEASLVGVLTEVLKYAGDVLVVDDGSTDRTPVAAAGVSDGPDDPPSAQPGLRGRLAHGLPGDDRRRLRRRRDARLRRAARAGADSRAGVAAGRRRYRFGQPLPARLRSRPEASRTAPADQRRSHALAQRMPGAESDRRVLRLQGLSDIAP